MNITQQEKMEQVSNDNYTLTYDEESGNITIKGTLRLNGIAEYQPVLDVLLKACEKDVPVKLNLQELDFLNSSGIASLSKFIIHARSLENIQLSIIGSKSIPWQGKSLVNLQRLMPALELEFI